MVTSWKTVMQYHSQEAGYSLPRDRTLHTHKNPSYGPSIAKSTFLLWLPLHCVLATQSCPILCNPMDGSHQASLCMGFSRQEYWSGLLFPSPGDLPNPGIKLGSPALQADSLPSKLQGSSYPFINPGNCCVLYLHTFIISKCHIGTSLVVQGRLRPPAQGGEGSIPGQGAKILCASRPKHQTLKQKQYCNKFNIDF